MSTNSWIILFVVLGVLVAIVAVSIDLYVRRKYSWAKISKAEEEAKNIKDNATRDAESMKKESILEAKEEVHKLRSDFEKESRERRTEIQRLERRNIQREETLDKKSDAFVKKEEFLTTRESVLERKRIKFRRIISK